MDAFSRAGSGPPPPIGTCPVNTENPTTAASSQIKDMDAVAIRFCGDSGDGMQLTGGQFTTTSALFGNDFATFPDFPAEIRAPRGTTFGVSGFQVQFADHHIHTPGDAVNALVAMNPAAFKMNISDVEPGGVVIVNEDEFTKVNLKKAGYAPDENPLDDESLSTRFQFRPIPISRLTRESLADSEMGAKDVDRCRNMYALGLVYWLFDRSLDTTIDYLETYFGARKNKPEVAAINVAALKAGYYFGETAELFPVQYKVNPAPLEAGTYRKISGTEATTLGFAAAAEKSGTDILYAGYPITPASELLHGLSALKHLGIRTFQAEDEIAAVCAAIGASFAGNLGVTGTSGPGLALKGEALGLATMLELPLVVVDVQRAGPATGMPTKTEQADLLQAMYGRSGETPCVIVAPSSPSDCFEMVLEAVRLAFRCMCPVLFLSDGSIANGAEPWRLPDLDAIEPIPVTHPTEPAPGDERLNPYRRDPDTLSRPWVIPGTPGLEHRVGGLEKQDVTGNVSYDGDNHQHMVETRAEKVHRAQAIIPPLEVDDPGDTDVLVLGWGSTRGSIIGAVNGLREEGVPVAMAHIRHLNPFPSNLGEILEKYSTIIVPENNTGQLRFLLQGKYLKPVIGINELKGRSFQVAELRDRIRTCIDEGSP
ncbi:MAG: 2-oxoglutarate ferredoxin oxidoreductase subunit alpha [Phycisphaerae bacterium]|nr:2-oxoglutarate ferredoxin oxidoreductase subunit alpha [Phycisphaerae bacterium]